MVTQRKRKERKARSKNRARAREMRHDAVNTEELFWSKVRDRKLGGFKFKRQYLVDPYIVDFVCLEKRLIVELDGPLHNEPYDAARDRFLRAQGYRIMRFKNEDVLAELPIMLMLVLEELNTTAPSP